MQKLYTSSSLFTLFILFTRVCSFAQIAASFDPTLGLSNFDEEVLMVKEQSDGKIIAIGYFSHYKNSPAPRIVRLNTDGTIDKTFNPGTGANSRVTCMAIQPDDKIIIGGAFTSFNGVTKNYFVRLNTNGSIDYTFSIGAGFNSTTKSIVVQPDGKILVGGSFTIYDGTFRSYIIRLNANGSIDNSFTIGTGFNARVNALYLQPDSKVLVGGLFTNYNGVAQTYFTRLNGDGTLDNNLVSYSGTGVEVNAIIMQADNKIILSGGLDSYGGVNSMGNVTRLNTDGSIDAPFYHTWIHGTFNSFALQQDGKLLIAHSSYSANYNGNIYDTVPGLTRFNTDGTVDESFQPKANNCLFNTVIVHSNGQIIAGGRLGWINNLSKPGLVVLTADGALALANSINNVKGANAEILTVAQQSDGKLLVAGTFRRFNGQDTKNLVRLNLDGSLDNTFNPEVTPLLDIVGNYPHLYAIAAQPDGKILIGGYVNNSGVVLRLNINGSIDNTFTNFTADGQVKKIVLQEDGKIFVTGTFSPIVRLNTNGTKDPTFNVYSGSGYDLVLQNDGKIVTGGSSLVRYDRSGKVDQVFASNAGSNVDGSIAALAIQPDGKIIVAGMFLYYNGIRKERIFRINADGTLDDTFVLTGTGFVTYIYTLAVLPNGQILVGGTSGGYNGVNINGVVRLNNTGSIDATFATGNTILLDHSSAYVNKVLVQNDGKIVAVGSFDNFNTIAANNIFRLEGNLIKSNYNTIRGSVYTDANNDCQYQNSEKTLPYVFLQTQPGFFYSNSNATGNYTIKVDTGAVTYTLFPLYNSIQNKLLTAQCNVQQVAMTGYNKDTCCYNFAEVVSNCSLLNVSIQNTRMRRCSKNNTHITYTNYGTVTASNATITVVYPDYVIPLSSVPIWTSKQGSVLTYQLNNVPVDFDGRITLIDSVICGDEYIRGLTACIKASISPKSTCVPENPSWDRSSISLSGSCQSGIVEFIITNTGTGNMTSSQAYRVYENDTLIYTGTYLLSTNENFSVSYPAKAKTIRLEADQHPLHPGNSRPSLSIENCGTASVAARNFITTSSLDDLDEHQAITCNSIVDSYDPNDKQAIPVGTGATHRIKTGQELEYIIRFQNTGTDTAYTVKIVDTLETSLDLSSFTQASSSYPYKLTVTGNGKAVLCFYLYNINLPPKTTDDVNSNGIISFRIKVKSDATLGTVIKNKSYIFFDYNSAIVTNETMHTIDDVVDTDFSKGNDIEVSQVVTSVVGRKNIVMNLYPNPTTGKITIEIPNNNSKKELRILSTIGILQRVITLDNTPSQSLQIDGLIQGMYIYQVWQYDEQQASGLLQIK